jgi:SAM-dependent methyltransferase
MSDWTGGYVADIGYTHGYYAELNPLRARFALLRAGYAVGATSAACELGFGQGISINAHASASLTEWHGTDFNPSQAGFAQELGSASTANVHLHDESFEEFCNRPDLPQFDFIGLHGIWSWISDENRKIIVEFARRRLKVGGVFYVSYNTQPGWAAMAPLRDLMTEHAELMGAEGAGIVSRIDGSIEFAEKLMASGAAFGLANPQIAGRVQALKKQNRHYLAHEYFNSNWVPMSISKMQRWLDEAKLSYGCPANMLEHIDAINLTPDQRKLINEIPDRMFRETVRDFITNTQFRRDYWVKGLRPLSAIQRVELLRQQRFVASTPKDKITLNVDGVLGEASMAESIYQPIIEVMGDYQIRSLHDIERAVEGKGVDFNSLVEAITILIGKGNLYPVQDDAAIAAAIPRTRAFNRKLCEQARYSEAVSALASPVIGGSVPVSRMEQLMLLARADGLASPEGWSRFILRIMGVQGQRVLKDGKMPETAEEELNLLVEMANDFRSTRLPVLDALQIQC